MKVCGGKLEQFFWIVLDLVFSSTQIRTKKPRKMFSMEAY